jgi:acyl-CoA thioesterase
VGTSHFARSSAVESVGSGRYRASVPQDWNCPNVPHGGFMTAMTARAMTAELDDPMQRLRTITSVFAAPVAHGDIEVDVTVARRGRTMSQLSATTKNPGAAAGHITVAAFGASRPGFSFTDRVPPEVPEPDECRSFGEGAPDDWPVFEPFNFWQHVEGKPALGHAPWEPYEPESALFAQWFRFVEPARLDDGRWDPLALVTMCDVMPAAVDERIGQNQVRFLPPSVDLTVHLFDDARSEWILAVNRARWAGEGYASADMELWDMHSGAPRLVAYGTQIMFFVFPDGLPPMAS